MKHKIYTIVIMLATIVFVSQSCKKEESVVQPNNSTNQLLGAGGGSEDNTESLINKFIDRMDIVRENPNYEGSEYWNYSRDSTVWYIEAALNYKYAGKWLCNEKETHSDLYNIDSSFSMVNDNNNNYNIVAIQESYDELASSLENQYKNISADSKYFVLSNIIDSGTDGGFLILKQYNVIAIENIILPTTDWYWGLKKGRCDGTYYMQYDATDVIEQMYSSQSVHITLPLGKYIYHTALDFSYITADDVPLASGSNPFGFYDKKLFMGPDNTCMNSTMISYYYNYYISLLGYDVPNDKIFIFGDLESGIFPYAKSGTGAHELYNNYGVLHYAVVPMD